MIKQIQCNYNSNATYDFLSNYVKRSVRDSITDSPVYSSLYRYCISAENSINTTIANQTNKKKSKNK